MQENNRMRVFHLRDTLTYHENLPFVGPEKIKYLSYVIEDIKSISVGYLGIAKTLQMFFRYLHISGIDKHSIDREKFWKTYLAAGHLSQAWIVAAPSAEQIFKQEFKIKDHQIGLLKKSRRVDEKQAVLLMCIGQLIIAEWSHIGKCRFWFQNNLQVPKLYNEFYKREELTEHASYIQQHYFTSKGLWQKDASIWISENAKIKNPWIIGCSQ